MDGAWVWLIASICGGVGAIMLLLPGTLGRIDEFLNREWGSRELFALRLGLPFEKHLEERLNSTVLQESVVWDGVLRRHPRWTGASLCVIAVVLMAIHPA